MQFIEKIHNWTMLEPTKYGWFHIIFLLLTIVVTTLLIIYFRDCKEKTMKKIVLFTWIGLVFFGILKELIVSYNGETLKYNWGSFPFQFCETPLYIYPILILNKNKKFQNALISFIATYVFFAGFALMVNPDRMFSVRVVLNFRTMYQHGSQVVMGLFLFAWNRKNMNLRMFIDGSLIFLVLTIIASMINNILGPLVAPEYSVNMFWISRYYETNLMILDRVQPHVHWVIFVILYILAFAFCAICSLFVEFGGYRLIQKIQLSKQKELEYNN